MRKWLQSAFFLCGVVVMFALAPLFTPVLAQQDLITITVNAGFDGRFRDNMWLPLQVNLVNNGDSIDGQLVVRPERNTALASTYSTPVTLATGARQTVTLNAVLRGFASSVLIELISESGVILREIEVPVLSLSPRDRLYIVVSNSASAVIDLSEATTAGQAGVQINWQPLNLPDRIGILSAVDAIVFNDVDSGTLTPAQRHALNAWVVSGGHLIVTGGVGWQSTSAAFTDLLPLQPTNTQLTSSLDTLALYVGDQTTLTGETRIATGTLAPYGQVLVATDDAVALPLIVRRAYGNGTVDYLTFDPLLAPFREWSARRALWLNMLSTTSPRPTWANHTLDASYARDALSILPGVSALPSVLTMLGFLVIYIAAIGPLNYLVLTRLNRRELAWVTIPLCILVFTSVAWTTGFNLRGSDAIISRLSVVQVWSGVDTAQLNQYIGVVAPRRADYSLTMPDDRLLRPLTLPDMTSQANIRIQEATVFSAVDFAVDASFVAGFSTVGAIDAPALRGQVSLIFGERRGTIITARGVLRNDTPYTLYDPVILLPEGYIEVLDEPLAPGEVRPFETVIRPAFTLAEPAIPSNLETSVGLATIPQSSFGFPRRFDYPLYQRTVSALLGNRDLTQDMLTPPTETETEQQERLRRGYFLASMIADQFGSSSRGWRVYFAGWSDASPADQLLAGAAWQPLDSTLYLVELDVELIPPENPLTIRADQFTWTALQREGLLSATTTEIETFGDVELVFRFTPLTGFVLEEVVALDLYFDRRRGTLRETQISLWNWNEQIWEEVEINGDERIITLQTPQRFLGANNAVQMQIVRNASTGQLSLDRIAIEQRGFLRTPSS